MFVEITNTPRRYAWGSTTTLATWQGRAPTGDPEAELWFGTHPRSPARLVEGEQTLTDAVGEMGFLVKVLAAAEPLSLQVHPPVEQAVAGFARENAAGIPLDAPHRNYRDANAKPELIYSMSPEFRALVGFRPVAHTRATLEDGGVGHLLPELREDSDIPATVRMLLSGGTRDIVDEVSAAAGSANGSSWDAVRGIAEHYPGDPGIVIALLLNSVTLGRGEAMFVPGGTLHSYQEGFGIELMGASDNVLRAGLTLKHIDVDEVLTVLDCGVTPYPRIDPIARDEVNDFVVSDAGLRLRILHEGAAAEVAAPAIVVVIDGEAEVGSGSAAARFGQSQAVAVTAGVEKVSAGGQVAVATST